MKTNNSFGCRFLSVFLCLSMLLAPIVTLADAVPASQALKDSVMSADEAVTVVEGKVLETPLYRLVEDASDISGEKTYAFTSGNTVGNAVTFLKYATTELEWKGTSSGVVYDLPVDIVDGNTVMPAGKYVAAPTEQAAYEVYEWYIKNTTGFIYTPNDMTLNKTLSTSNITCGEHTYSSSSRGDYVRIVRNNDGPAYMAYAFSTDNEAKGITDTNSVISVKCRWWGGNWSNTSDTDGVFYLIDKDENIIAAYPIPATAGDASWKTYTFDMKDKGISPLDVCKIEFRPFGSSGSSINTTDAKNFDIGYVGFFASESEAASYSASHPLSATYVMTQANIASTTYDTGKQFNVTQYSAYTRFVLKTSGNVDVYKFYRRESASNYLMVRYRTEMPLKAAPLVLAYVDYNDYTKGTKNATTITGSYTNDGMWHTAVFDLSDCSSTTYPYLRLDFSRQTSSIDDLKASYFDIATIAYFNSAADAEAAGDSLSVPEVVYTGSNLEPTTDDSKNRVTFTNKGSYVNYVTKNKDPYVVLTPPKDRSSNNSNLNYIAVKYRLYNDTVTKFGFNSYANSAWAYSESTYVPDGGWHSVVLDAPSNLKNSATQFRFDLFDADTGTGRNIGLSVDIASIAIFNTKEEAQMYANDLPLLTNSDFTKYSYTVNSVRDTSKYLYGEYGAQTNTTTDRVAVLVGDTKTPVFLPTDGGIIRVFDPVENQSSTATLPGNGANLHVYEKVADTGYVVPEVKAWLIDDYGCVATGVNTSAPTGAYLKVMAGDEVYDVPVTVDMLYKADGTTKMSTATQGTYYNCVVKYEGKVIYSKFILVVRNGTSLVSGSFYRLVTPIDPDGSVSKSIKDDTNYMLIDRAEAGYGKALSIQGLYSTSPITTRIRKIYEIEIDGEKQYITQTESVQQHEVWKTNFVADAHPLNPNFVGPYFTLETQAYNNGSNTNITGYLYYDLNGTSRDIVKWDASIIPSTTTLKLSQNINSTAANKAGYLWCEIADTNISYAQQKQSTSSTAALTTLNYFTHRDTTQHTVTVGKGTGLACFAATQYHVGSNTSNANVNVFDSYSNEWRGLHFANEIGNFTTRVPVDAYIVGTDKNASLSNMTVYDRVYYYEEDTSIKSITAHIDTFDVAIQHGAAGADVTGANLVITTTKTDGSVSVSRVPITMDMLSTDSAGKNAVSTTDSADANKTTNAHVFYQDTRIGTINLTVAAETGDPVYPNPGSVVITKELDTSTHDYWKTGTARLELSVTGVPTASGADVVIAIDNSGSMEGKIGTTSTTRRQAVTEAIKAALTTFANSPEDIAVSVVTFDGYDLIDPNYVLNKNANTSYKVYTNCDSNIEPDTAQFLTSGFNQYVPDVDDRFVENEDLTTAKINEIVANYKYTGSGTNYDRGLELAYETLNARQKQNALNGTKRDSYLIFMADGGTLQMNYMGLNSDTNNDMHDQLYLGHLDDGKMKHDPNKADDPDYSSYLPKADGNVSSSTVHPYYYTHYNELGEMWMAEAIKGSVDKKYKVIDPDANPSDDYLDYVNGLGATVYTIGVGVLNEGQYSNYINSQIPLKETSYAGSGEVLRKISSDWSCDDVRANHSTEVDDGKVEYFKKIYKDNKYAKFVNDDVTAIKNIFAEIAGNISVLSNAVFTDTMSDYVELQTKKQNADAKDPKITVTEYQTYKYSEIGSVINGVYVSAEQVGKIKPGTAANVKETVTFTTDANGKLTAAYSNEKGNTTNILANNKITAQYFTYDLNSATFTWNIGEIPENKYVLAFDVYLKGSMEGARDDGTYPTNKDTSTKTGAYLTYTNFEGNAREIQVPTPYLPWGDAQVSVAYYLVDDKGRPITHLGGSPVSFDLAYKVTTPEIFTSFALNSETGKITAENLPQGLSLYDSAASYEVKATSDNGGAWKITAGEGKTKSTYVTQYSSGSNTATNEQMVYTDLSATDEFIAEGGFESKAGYTYSNTVVWFAVTSPISASPETVVIDYGLPVDINITANDIGGFKATAITSRPLPTLTDDKGNALTNNGVPVTVYQSTEADYTNEYASYFTAEGVDKATGSYGKAELIDDDFVKYTPTGMEMDGKDVFTYALQFENGTPSYAVGMDYLFRKLTVVPATSIYYEEKFVDFETYYSTLQSGVKTPAANAWENVSNINGASGSDNINGYPQAQDRPGVDETIFDVGNIYGYDEQYIDCATFSLGNSKKITVNDSITGEATFTFTGTGFDIIGLTNHDTGTIIVDVYAGVPKIDNGSNLITDTPVKSLLVDTYYGYTYEQQSDNSYKWVINADASETLYQVPVISVENLDYGKYTAVVTVSYSQYLDNRYDENGDKSYDFYFDAVRIYNPANNGANDSVIKDAYIKDNECWPMYTELRGTLIAAKDVLDYAASETEAAKVGGSMFIDGCPTIDKNATGYDQWVNVDYFHGRYTYERNQFDDNLENDPSGAIKNYMNYGPNNEVYLAPGQAISFTLGVSYQGSDITDDEKVKELEKLLADYTASVHVAIKAAKGTPIINMYAVGTPAEGSEKKYEFTKGLMETTINSATELYYDITALDGMTVVIMNSAEANSGNILSITNVKRTFTKDPAELINQVSETATVEKASAVYINRQTVELALASLEMESDSRSTFEPDTFDVSVSKSSVKEGKTVTVTVKTSSDVDSITVNGETVTKYRRSLFTKQRTWTYTVKATEAGELPIEVVAYNADGEFSEPVTETVEVTSNSSTGGSSSSGWFDKWFGGWFDKWFGGLFGKK